MLLVFVLQFNYYLFGLYYFICSIGSLGADGSSDYVSNVMVNRARLSGTTNGLRIKTWQVIKNLFSNMHFFLGAPPFYNFIVTAHVALLCQF